MGMMCSRHIFITFSLIRFGNKSDILFQHQESKIWFISWLSQHMKMCKMACGGRIVVEKGYLIYHDIIRSVFDVDLMVGNCIIDFYVKCGLLQEAWTMITGYIQHEQRHFAYTLYYWHICLSKHLWTFSWCTWFLEYTFYRNYPTHRVRLICFIPYISMCCAAQSTNETCHKFRLKNHNRMWFHL